MNRRLLGMIFFLSLPAAAQHPHSAPSRPASSPPAGEASHHACLDQERAALARGEGFGMAMLADRSGYPGPRTSSI